eukprot:872038-Karenia_brevis.AAC.1
MDLSGLAGGNSLQTTSANLLELPLGPAMQLGPGGQMVPVVRPCEVAYYGPMGSSSSGISLEKQSLRRE